MQFRRDHFSEPVRSEYLFPAAHRWCHKCHLFSAVGSGGLSRIAYPLTESLNAFIHERVKYFGNLASGGRGRATKQLRPLAPHHYLSSLTLFNSLVVQQQCHYVSSSSQARLFCYLRRKMRTTNVLGCLLLNLCHGAGESKHAAIVVSGIVLSGRRRRLTLSFVLPVVFDRYALATMRQH